MKKIIFVFLVSLVVSSSVSAQSKAKAKQTDPFSLIISVGSNWSIFTNPANSASTLTQAKQVSGVNAGITGNWPLSQSLAFQAGVRLSAKGSRAYADTPYFHLYSTTRPLYLQIPVDLVYSHKIGSGFTGFIGVGAYIAKGVGGKNSYSGISGYLGQESTISGNDKILYGNPHSSYAEVKTYGNLQPFDFGFNALLGVEYWKLRLALGYDGGLSKISYGTNTPNSEAKNKSISLTLGFHF